MRRWTFCAVPVCAAVLAVPAPAAAGGWTTVSLSSLPVGLAPGQPWSPAVTVRAHGFTPVDGMRPSITIRQGRSSRAFVARPAGRPGVYRARVVFPRRGVWRYELSDGLTDQVVTYPAVRVGPSAPPAAAPSSSGGGSPAGRLLAGIALAVLGAGGLLAERRRRPGPAPGTA